MIFSNVLFNSIFGWSTVVIALLLVAILFVYIKSLLVFNNAEIIKGKVINLMHIGELDLPTIEYQLDGEKLQFRSKTAIKSLAVGQELELQIANTQKHEPRIMDKDGTVKLPMVIYVISVLGVFFGYYAIRFLLF